MGSAWCAFSVVRNANPNCDEKVLDHRTEIRKLGWVMNALVYPVCAEARLDISSNVGECTGAQCEQGARPKAHFSFGRKPYR